MEFLEIGDNEPLYNFTRYNLNCSIESFCWRNVLYFYGDFWLIVFFSAAIQTHFIQFLTLVLKFSFTFPDQHLLGVVSNGPCNNYACLTEFSWTITNAVHELPDDTFKTQLVIFYYVFAKFKSTSLEKQSDSEKYNS